MSEWLRWLLIITYLLDVIVCIAEVIYRVITKRDEETPWEVAVIRNVIIVWFYLFIFIALWFDW